MKDVLDRAGLKATEKVDVAVAPEPVHLTVKLYPGALNLRSVVLIAMLI